MDNVPKARDNYLLLLITYWKVFDDVNIPDGLISEILEKATQPETVSRSRRKALEYNRVSELLKIKMMAEEAAKVRAL